MVPRLPLHRGLLLATTALVYVALLPPDDLHAQMQVGSSFSGQGPGPAVGNRGVLYSNDNPPNGTTSGSVQALATDPTNPNVIYLGSNGGGIWKTTNGGQSWMPLTDNLASLSIGSLSLDPTDATNRTLIAGTAATSAGGFASISTFSSARNFGGVLNGLLYSSDGGASFSRLGATELSGQSIIDVQARGSVILAASWQTRVALAAGENFSGGLYRSTNTGSSFTLVSGAGGSGLPAGPISSLVSDPQNANTFYAAVTASSAATYGQTGVYKSTDGGATWALVFSAAQSAGTITGANQTSIKLAAGPNGSLALVVVDGGSYSGLFYSGNGGTSFTQQPDPGVYNDAAPLHGAIAIDPNNSRIVYVTGNSTQTYTNGFFLTGARINTLTGTVTPLGDTGAPTNTANGSNIHPDSRVIAFDANGRMLVGVDGGIFARTNPTSTTGVWLGLNGNLSTYEPYSIAYDGNSKRILVAAQDNGRAFQATPGGATYNQILGGDGINARVNDRTFGTNSALYSSSQNLGGINRIIVDSNGTTLATAPVTFSPGVTGVGFTSQFILNNIDPSRVAVGGTRVYVGQDTSPINAATVPITLTNLGAAGGTVTALAYGTTDNVNAVLAGAGSFNNPAGRLLLSTTGAANSLTLLPAYTGLAPTSVAFDTRTIARFFAADSVSLYGTSNTGATFTNLSGNLPANFIQPTSIGFISNNGVAALLVGGLNDADNAGNPLVVVDSDATGALTGWRRFGTGLPNALIFTMNYDSKADTLIIGEDGRGIFVLYDVTSNFPSASVLQFGLANNDSTPNPSILTGARPLTKYGPGTLTINGASSYTGSTTVLGGVVSAGAANVLAPNSAFSLSAGTTLALNGFDQTIGSLTGAGGVSLGAGTLTTGGNGTSTTYDGAISGSGGIVKVGAGNFVLTGANTYSGGTSINGGTLSVLADPNLGAAAGGLAFGGGTLSTLGNFTTSRSITLNAGGGTFAPAAGTSLTATGAISGAGTLTLAGPGTLTITGATTYTGATLVNGGTLSVASSGGLVSPVTVAAGGVLTTSGTLSGGLTNGGSVVATGGQMNGAIANLAGTFTVAGSVKSDQTFTNGGGANLAIAETGAYTLAGLLTNNGAVTVASGGSLTAGGIANNGSLTISSGATVIDALVNSGTVTNAGTYMADVTNQSGGTFINTGTVNTLTTPFANAGTLATGGILNGGLVNTGLVTASGQINGAVTNAGSMTLTGTLTGVASLTNTGLLDLGGTTFGIGSLAGNVSAAVVRNGALVTGSDNSSTTYAGSIADGAGQTSLTKTGSGTLTLTGANTYTGPTTILSGTLLVTGSTAAPIIVLGGSTVSGTGTYTGPIAVTSGGALAPGLPGTIGTLNAANVAFASGSTFQVKVDAAGNADRLAATGTVTLGGATLAVLANTGTYNPQTVYTIVTAAGGVTGQFGTLTSNFAFLTPSVSYGANQTQLFVTRNDVPLASVAQTPNQAATATGVQSGVLPTAVSTPGAATIVTPTASPLAMAILNLSAPAARQAFDTLSGQMHAGTVRVLSTDALGIRDTLLGRMRFGLSGPTPALANLQGAELPSAFAADLPGRRASEPVQVRTLDPTVFALWGEGFGSFGTAFRTSNAGRVDRTTSGFLAGADVTIAGVGRFGIAGGYADTQADLTSLVSRSRIQTGTAALYGAVVAGPTIIRAGLTYAGHNIDTSRAIIFPGFASSTRAKFDGWTGQVFGEVGVPLKVGRDGGAEITLEPFAGLAGIRVRTSSFAETGGVGAGLTGFARDHDIGTATAGLRMETRLGEAGEFGIRTMLGYRAAFGDIDPKALLAFTTAATPAPFQIGSVPLDRHALVAEANFDWRVAKNTTVSLATTGAYGARAIDQAIKGRVEIRF